MKSHRLRRYALWACGVLLIPPLLWMAVVLIAPTNWARRHIVAMLEARTGRIVRLERLSARLLGGFQLKNLEIGSPQTTDDPWLKAPSVRLEFSVIDLLGGTFRPRSIVVDDADVRVLRRANGTLELADLILPEEKRPTGGQSARADAGIAFHIRGGSVTVIDEPSQTRLRLKIVEGDGVREDRSLTIQNLRGSMNGGPFYFAGALDRVSGTPRFEARFRADDVVLDDGMNVLRYAVPVLAGAPLNLTGRLNADIYVQGRGPSWDAISQTLAGRGEISIKPVDLDGAPLVAELSKITELSRQGRIASVRSDFVIKDRRVVTEHFTLNIGRVPMTLAGWTDFDGRIDYRINLKALTDRIPDKARRLLGELNVDLGKQASLTLRGTVNQMLVQVNGVSLDRGLLREVKIKREDREKLRVLGRQFLDQLSR